jgi:hypothetical protein
MRRARRPRSPALQAACSAALFAGRRKTVVNITELPEKLNCKNRAYFKKTGKRQRAFSS